VRPFEDRLTRKKSLAVALKSNIYKLSIESGNRAIAQVTRAKIIYPDLCELLYIKELYLPPFTHQDMPLEAFLDMPIGS
jgi:hypothetical protein